LLGLIISFQVSCKCCITSSFILNLLNIINVLDFFCRINWC